MPLVSQTDLVRRYSGDRDGTPFEFVELPFEKTMTADDLEDFRNRSSHYQRWANGPHGRIALRLGDLPAGCRVFCSLEGLPAPFVPPNGLWRRRTVSGYWTGRYLLGIMNDCGVPFPSE